MRRKRFGAVLGLLALVAVGVASVTYGVLVLRAGVGLRAGVNNYGQLDMAAFAIPVGAVMLLVALLVVAIEVRQWLEVRKLSRQYGRPDQEDDA